MKPPVLNIQLCIMNENPTIFFIEKKIIFKDGIFRESRQIGSIECFKCLG